MTSLERAVASANPVLDPEAAMTPETHARIRHLAIGHRETPADNRNMSIGRGVWLSAAAVILIAVIGVLVLGNQGRPGLSAANQPNVDLARAYIDARNNHDTKLAMTLMADNVEIDEYPILRDISQLETAFEYLEFVDEEMSVSVCEPTAVDDREVVCGYRFENRLTMAVGSEPVPGTVRFRFSDGKIIEVENYFDFTDHELRVLEPLVQSISRRLEDRFREYLRFAFRGEEVVLTPRLEALDQLTEEIEAYAPSG